MINNFLNRLTALTNICTYEIIVIAPSDRAYCDLSEKWQLGPERQTEVTNLKNYGK